MARNKLRIALAGAGSFGREHLRELSAMGGIEVAGVADTNLAAAQAAATRYGAASAESDAVRMIERLRPDGFVIATPGHSHVALALAALRLDIPVLLEKPVGLCAADAGVLIAAERKSTAFVLPGHILRFSNAYGEVAGIIRAGEIGPVLSVSMRNHRDETHAVRYPGIDPVLMTMVHDIDQALWITGAPLASVLALRRPKNTARSETLITGTGTSGCMWHISNAWTFPTLEAPADRIEVVGERGAVEMELGRYIRVFGSKFREIELPLAAEDNMLRSELTYFTACIADGRKPEVVTLEDARLGLVAADAILESLRTGAVVRP